MALSSQNTSDKVEFHDWKVCHFRSSGGKYLHLRKDVVSTAVICCRNAIRRLGQKVAKSEGQREEMYMFGEEASELDRHLGACAKGKVSVKWMILTGKGGKNGVTAGRW